MERVTRRYGEMAAVDDVSLSVGAGEFLTLLGPSGSGKTTTLSLIAGFVTPDSGRVCVGDRDITRVPAHQRNLGVVFQNYALFPHMTVLENVMYPLKLRRVPTARAREMAEAVLSQVRLQGFEGRHPRQLSGGQQQRVALARALVYEAPVLLMDEPFGALDRKLRREMQLELRDLHQRIGVTIIFVTHDQEEALTLSDRVALMHAGRVVQVDAPRTLYEEPATEFVADFIGDTNFLKGRVALVDGHPAVVTDAGTTIRTVGRAAAEAATVSVALRPERIRFLDAGAAHECENAFEAEVEDVIFLGDSSKYVLRLPRGDRLVARGLNLTVTPRRAGKVLIGWRQADATVLS
jgi:spermidine/putrescine ABC transporter ATP-binding subunit